MKKLLMTTSLLTLTACAAPQELPCDIVDPYDRGCQEHGKDVIAYSPNVGDDWDDEDPDDDEDGEEEEDDEDEDDDDEDNDDDQHEEDGEKEKDNKGLGNGDEGDCRGAGCTDPDNPGQPHD